MDLATVPNSSSLCVGKASMSSDIVLPFDILEATFANS